MFLLVLRWKTNDVEPRKAQLPFHHEEVTRRFDAGALSVVDRGG